MEFKEALAFLQENHSSVVTTIGKTGLPQATIVRAGPYDGKMAFVVRGGTVKLANLNRNPACTVLTVTADWRKYASVEGKAEIHGPESTEAEALRLLLRAAFSAAGGTHEDWDAFDRVMLEERRAVVLVTPARVYGRV